MPLSKPEQRPTDRSRTRRSIGLRSHELDVIRALGQSLAWVVEESLAVYTPERYGVQWPRFYRAPNAYGPRGDNSTSVITFTGDQDRVLRGITKDTPGAFPDLIRAAVLFWLTKTAPQSDLISMWTNQHREAAAS